MLSSIKKKFVHGYRLFKENRAFSLDPMAELKFLEDGLRDTNELAQDDHQLISRLIASYQESKKAQRKVHLPYQPGGQWEFDISARRSEYLDALRTSDVPGLSNLLLNFFRNSGVAGLWRYPYYAEILNSSVGKKKLYINQIIRDFRIVSEFVDDFDVAALAIPQVGNPWGYYMDGTLILPTACGHYQHASHVYNLIGDLEIPVIAEIGGGFGGFAYYLMSMKKPIRYVGFDLPEIILMEQYFLMKSFPDKKFLLYGENKQADITENTINSYDVILMPNFALPKLEDRSVDIFINVHSLSEMDYRTVEEYIHQIARITKKYFLHENSDQPKKKITKGGFVEVVSSNFPIPLGEFKRIYKHNAIFENRYREHLYERISTNGI